MTNVQPLELNQVDERIDSGKGLYSSYEIFERKVNYNSSQHGTFRVIVTAKTFYYLGFTNMVLACGNACCFLFTTLNEIRR